ncbi:hypothetical protein GCM10011581_37160 [Saccharopolyspora subtropica]|uniref:Uncharacterized protein n=1 Tax=Saccharopolyspora thermophila TaxID=89367 RepID=A0A917K127_9PSEU|nr:hypothetical protein GCM10011581_37160 [Saccharopolyspora subtropica]
MPLRVGEVAPAQRTLERLGGGATQDLRVVHRHSAHLPVGRVPGNAAKTFDIRKFGHAPRLPRAVARAARRRPAIIGMGDIRVPPHALVLCARLVLRHRRVPGSA